LRCLAQPVTPQDQINERDRATLFALVESGAVEVTTSEAILAEVAFLLALAGPRYYDAPRPTASGLKELLRLRRCRMPAKELALRTLDL
jgi:hypothetical protein